MVEWGEVTSNGFIISFSELSMHSTKNIVTNALVFMIKQVLSCDYNDKMISRFKTESLPSISHWRPINPAGQ